MWHRVGGIAYYVLKKFNLLGQVNREFRNGLKSCYEMNLVKTTAFKDILYSLSTVFSEAQFPYAFLKGAYLSNEIYPDGLRTSNDFDVLVNQCDLTACTNLLLDNGFVQGFYRHEKGIVPATRRDILNSRMNRGETVPFLKQAKSVGMDVIEVDVNFSLDFKAKHERDLVSEILMNTQIFKIGDQQLSTLSKTDFLIQLCVHLYKEATIYNWVEMGRDLSLYKFCDIYAFVAKFGDSKYFSHLEEKIHHYGLERECYYALHNIKDIYPHIIYTSGYRRLLKSIKPQQEEFMSQILQPANDKTYSYNMPFGEWLFSYNKVSLLAEINA